MRQFFIMAGIALSVLSLKGQTSARLSLPALFADGMVLQQQCKAPVWGWGAAGTQVKLVGEWNPQDTVSATVDDSGRWMARISTARHGGPYTLQIFAANAPKEKIVLKDVMLGEVWLCSGQSNMEWTPANGIERQKEEIASAADDQIRYFSLRKQGSDYPQDDCNARWEKCTPEVMSRRSAVAYFFGRHLQQQLNVPVGVIVSAWGGTPAEVWIPAEVIAADRRLEAEKVRKPYPWWPIRPGALYNNMIHPLQPFALAGTIWYQGESNRENPQVYQRLMQRLIESWRTGFGQEEMPFYIVQIAPFRYDGDAEAAALIREAQEQVCKKMPHTGLVVTNDIGNPANIHPAKKLEVGVRLANLALGDHYKMLQEGYQNAFLEQCTYEKGKLKLTFGHAGKRLVCNGKEWAGLRVTDAKGEEVAAKQQIAGNTLVVDIRKTAAWPLQVSYCFDNATIGNLFNEYNLPVAPFRVEVPRP